MNPKISPSRLPVLEEGLQDEAFRVLWPWNLPEILREFARSKPDKPLFLHPTQGFFEVLSAGNGHHTGHRFPAISDQNLHPRLHLIQIFTKVGLEFGHSSRFHVLLLFVTIIVKLICPVNSLIPSKARCHWLL